MLGALPFFTDCRAYLPYYQVRRSERQEFGSANAENARDLVDFPSTSIIGCSSKSGIIATLFCMSRLLKLGTE
jgi:hypothetical protein